MIVKYTIRRDDLMKLQYRTYIKKSVGTAEKRRIPTVLVAALRKALQQ